MLVPRVAGLAIIAIALLLVAPLPAAAQLKVVDEVKLGALAHDLGFLGHHLEKGVDVNLEMLFTPPDILSVIGSPRPVWACSISPTRSRRSSPRCRPASRTPGASAEPQIHAGIGMHN